MTEKKNNETRWHEIRLVVLGFVLATAGQWGWQIRAERREARAATLALCELVRFEISSCESAKALLTGFAATTPSPTNRVLPRAFDNMHDASLYLEIRSRCLGMDSRVVSAVVRYDAALKQAQFLRDLNRDSLQTTGGDVHDTSTSAWQAYIVTLDELIKSGTNLIGTIGGDI